MKEANVAGYASADLSLRSACISCRDCRGYKISCVIHSKSPPGVLQVRTMRESRGDVTEAGPSIAVQMVGLNTVPIAGDEFCVCSSEQEVCPSLTIPTSLPLGKMPHCFLQQMLYRSRLYASCRA